MGVWILKFSIMDMSICMVLLLAVIFTSINLTVSFEFNGETGAGHKFKFEMCWNCNVPDYHEMAVYDLDSPPYTGGDPGCCDICRTKANTHSVDYFEGNTDFFNWNWDQFGFKHCTCFQWGRTKRGLDRLKSQEDGPILGYCGNNQTFLNQVDGTFGVNKLFKYQTAEEIDWIWDVESSEGCCAACGEKFPESQMFEFDRDHHVCKCYKAIPGKNPKTVSAGSYNGVCPNFMSPIVAEVG